MIYREVEEKDLKGIANLYKKCFNIEIKEDRYNYWYKFNNKYTAVICEQDNLIVGHNAFIINEHVFKGQTIKVALSVAGMVDSENSKSPGTFLKLIESTIKIFNSVDIVIAFPNKKAEPFWTRVLKFNTIYDNYFYITPELLKISEKTQIDFEINRKEEYISKRIDNHGKFIYHKHKINDFEFIFKEYNGNIELIYINKISNELYEALQYIFEKGFNRINIISIYGEELMKFGFEKSTHNVFVYKWLNEKLKNEKFDCQMIDSDVF
jgi:hypothetical protein